MRPSPRSIFASLCSGFRVRRVYLAALLLLPAAVMPRDAVGQDVMSRLNAGERAFVDSIPYSSGPIDNTTGLFVTRFSEAPASSTESIYMKPTVTTLTLQPAGDGRVESVGDVQAIFPVSAGALARAVGSYGNYHLVSHRTVFSVDHGTSRSLIGYHKQIQMIAATFLGIGQEYLFATNDYVERLSGGAYGFRWNLERAYQNVFYELYGSWYLKPVVYQGQECTYVRYFNVTGFTKEPPLPPGLLGRFTASDYQLLLTDAFKVAKAIDVRNG